jgi:predicted peptidase
MADKNSFDELRIDLMSLYEKGKYVTALELVEKNESNFPEQSPRTTFWKICLLSLDGRLEDALSTFRQGLDNGMWWAESQFVDTDLDPLRDLQVFEELVTESVQRWEQERKNIKREHALILPDAPSSVSFPLLVVLHGRNGNKEAALESWDFARNLGWAVLSAQSTQPLFPGSYCWDNPIAGLHDIRSYLEHTLLTNEIDRERILLGGFSQGSGMTIYAALSGELPVHGFIADATWWADVESLAALAVNSKNVRGYFVTGEKDYTIARVREIQDMLKQYGIPYTEEFHPGLGHEFPADFDKSFTQAVEFIFGK